MAAAAGWFGGVAEALSPLLAKPPFSFVTRRGGARAGEAAAGVEGAQERVAACKSGECACASHRSFVRWVSRGRGAAGCFLPSPPGVSRRRLSLFFSCHDQRKDSQFYQVPGEAGLEGWVRGRRKKGGPDRALPSRVATGTSVQEILN